MSSDVVGRRMDRTASFGLGGLARQTTRSTASAAEAKQRFFCSGRDPKKSVAHREPSGSPQQHVTGGETTIDSLRPRPATLGSAGPRVGPEGAGSAKSSSICRAARAQEKLVLRR